MDKEKGDIILYATKDDKIKIELRVFNKTAWLNQQEIADLFQKAKSTINEHIKNIYSEGELEKSLTMSKFGNSEFADKPTNYYNLDMILAVGYRVKSHIGTQFRKWATSTLKEYLIKGFVMDDERLKNPQNGDYFDELLARIRDIRASEKRIYQKIKDIYKLGVDYDKNTEATKKFFKIVQNKTLFAITGKTAAEIIHNRANSDKANMGLTSWRGEKIRKSDISIAKNYLNEAEIEDLNRIIVMYLDHAEYMAKEEKLIYMKDWEEKLNEFLKYTKKEILQNSGKVSNEIAKKLAESEYKKFEQTRLKQDKEKDDEEILKEIEAIERKND